MKVTFENLIEGTFNTVATCTKPVVEASKATYVCLMAVKEGVVVGGFKEAKPLSSYKDTLAAARAARAARIMNVVILEQATINEDVKKRLRK